MGKKVELLYDGKAILGEGPCWDSQNGILYWIDIEGKTVNALDVEKGKNRQIRLGEKPGCVVQREAGGLVVALQNGIFLLDENDASLTLISNPERDLPGNRSNDGKCDKAGRFYIGTMSDAQTEISGSFYCLDKDRSIHKKLEKVEISNGIAWSPDNRILFFIDTPTRRVDAFDYDFETGDISNRRTVVHIPENHGHPDGMNIDEEGMLWVCEWGGGRISRWNPLTGRLIEEVKIPATYVTSCVFGGKNMDQLYVTTARVALTEEEYEKEPLAGGIFVVDAGVRGPESYKYKG